MTHVSNLINEIPKESTEGFRNECRVIGFNRYVRKGRVKIYMNNKTEIQCNNVEREREVTQWHSFGSVLSNYYQTKT